LDSGSTSPSEGCGEAAEVHAAHGEVWDRGGGKHVRFACNVNLTTSLALDHPLSHSAPHPTVWEDDTLSHFGNPPRPPNDTAATQKGTCSLDERGVHLDK
jgi:hypothetical protein